MQIPWSTIIWCIIAVSVYLFGIYEGRGQGYKKRKAEEAQEKKDAPPAPSVPVTVKVDDPGLMRIKNEHGTLTLDLDGVRADTAALTADQRKRLIEMLTVIRPWLEGRPAPAPAPVATSAVMPSPPLSQPQPVASTPVSSAPRPAPQPTPTTTKAAEKEAAAPKAIGIVGQIDSVLQARLVG